MSAVEPAFAPAVEIVVVIPAANEQGRIGACLDSVARAREAVATTPVEVVVVLDRCTDATADIVADYAGVTTVACDARNVGVARASGAALALSGRDPARTWLANTDADSIVPADWLSHMLVAAHAGWDLMLGTVVPGPELPHDVRRRWARRHRSADGHRHVHGANLGIRGDAYVSLGGWSPVTTGEDVELAIRAERAGLTVRRSGAAAVTTSARPVGRAPHGFSSYLRELAAETTAAGQ